jgi:hypothetical protein
MFVNGLCYIWIFEMLWYITSSGKGIMLYKWLSTNDTLDQTQVREVFAHLEPYLHVLSSPYKNLDSAI